MLNVLAFNIVVAVDVSFNRCSKSRARRDYYRVRTRDARRHVMRGKHQNSSTRLKAIESPMMIVFIMFCDRIVLSLHLNNFATCIYLAP
jgi:hypothetical protein